MEETCHEQPNTGHFQQILPVSRPPFLYHSDSPLWEIAFNHFPCIELKHPIVFPIQRMECGIPSSLKYIFIKMP
jgi:hypothetical protein